MIWLLLADLVVLVHAGFVLFVVCGGLALHRRPGLVWLHLPAVFWGAGIEFGGGVCPLTYLENHLRRLGGEAGYAWSFVTQYLEPVIYPAGLTRQTQMVLGAGVLLLNALIYGRLWQRSRRQQPGFGSQS